MATSYNANTDLVLANTVLVYVNSKPIAFAKDFKLTLSTSTIDTSSKFSGKFKNNLAGQNSWNITSSFLKTDVSGDTSFATLFDAWLVGSTVSVTLAVCDPATFEMTGTGQHAGTAIITSLDQNSVKDGVVDCSVTLEGTGALSRIAIA